MVPKVEGVGHLGADRYIQIVEDKPITMPSGHRISFPNKLSIEGIKGAGQVVHLSCQREGENKTLRFRIGKNTDFWKTISELKGLSEKEQDVAIKVLVIKHVESMLLAAEAGKKIKVIAEYNQERREYSRVLVGKKEKQEDVASREFSYGPDGTKKRSIAQQLTRLGKKEVDIEKEGESGTKNRIENLVQKVQRYVEESGTTAEPEDLADVSIREVAAPTRPAPAVTPAPAVPAPAAPVAEPAPGDLTIEAESDDDLPELVDQMPVTALGRSFSRDVQGVHPVEGERVLPEYQEAGTAGYNWKERALEQDHLKPFAEKATNALIAYRGTLSNYQTGISLIDVFKKKFGLKIRCHSAEQLFHFYKLPSGHYRDQILAESTPDQARRKAFDLADKIHQQPEAAAGPTYGVGKLWREASVNLMIYIQLVKASQRETGLLEVLLQSGDDFIIEDTSSRKEKQWGDAGDGSGRNLLGYAQMRAREILREEGVNSIEDIDEGFIDRYFQEEVAPGLRKYYKEFAKYLPPSKRAVDSLW